LEEITIPSRGVGLVGRLGELLSKFDL